MKLSQRIDTLRPTAVNTILAEVRSLQSQGRDLVSLMRGEPDLKTPAHIVEAAEAALRAGRTSYPDNRGEIPLREAVAVKLERDNRLSYDPATEVLVTTGATFGIYSALSAVLDAGDEVVVPDPVYDAYLSPIRLAGGVPKLAASRIEGGRFQVTRESLEAVYSPSTRAMLLNTPWNPTGTVLSGEEIAVVAKFVCDHDLWLISDEIYEAIVYDGHRHVAPCAAVPELRGRTILVNSLSKSYAMTGWRVGYCAGPPDVIRAMFLVLQQSSRGPATFIQDASAVALRESQQCVEEMAAEYASRRSRVIDALTGIPRCRLIEPEGGFFAMLDCREMGIASDSIRRTLLEQHGVVVVNGSAYGPSGEGTLRVSFASGGTTLERGLERLRRGLLESTR
jgi:aspartate aminotransferase